uniref:Tyrosine specific protein phosphatases domain-containing protein n=1 Tax=Meloidogyne enterolobii TaxID=390850 RepID=A0A6V7XFW6_MELEN|nr:unnamed protein product [Meloidogyne enterolobii]
MMIPLCLHTSLFFGVSCWNWPKISSPVKKGKTHLKRKVLLVCGDGITKNGNFAVFDIVMDRAATHERVGLKETARIVMDQRWGTVGSSDEYKLLHAMIKAQIQPLLQRARRSNASSQD